MYVSNNATAVCMYVCMYCKNVDINVFECMYVCIKVTHLSCRALLGQLGLLGSQAAHSENAPSYPGEAALPNADT